MNKYECKICGYIYDPEIGDFENGFDIPIGTDFGQLPADWMCPECGGNKSGFEKINSEYS